MVNDIDARVDFISVSVPSEVTRGFIESERQQNPGSRSPDVQPLATGLIFPGRICSGVTAAVPTRQRVACGMVYPTGRAKRRVKVGYPETPAFRKC